MNSCIHNKFCFTLSFMSINNIVPSGSSQNFSILASSHVLNISWAPLNPSQRNGVIINYLINCSLQGSIIYSTRTNSPSLQLTITGLEPFTNYICSVSAATVAGDGPAAIIHIMTNEDSKFI